MSSQSDGVQGGPPDDHHDLELLRFVHKMERMTLNMTPLRLAVLRFLASKPAGHNAKRMVETLCPREGCTGNQLSWTEQGLARQTGSVLKPLRDVGLIVDVDRRVGMYALNVQLTAAGRALLAEHDEAAARAELDAAICSGA